MDKMKVHYVVGLSHGDQVHVIAKSTRDVFNMDFFFPFVQTVKLSSLVPRMPKDTESFIENMRIPSVQFVSKGYY